MIVPVPMSNDIVLVKLFPYLFIVVCVAMCSHLLACVSNNLGHDGQLKKCAKVVSQSYIVREVSWSSFESWLSSIGVSRLCFSVAWLDSGRWRFGRISKAVSGLGRLACE